MAMPLDVGEANFLATPGSNLALGAGKSGCKPRTKYSRKKLRRTKAMMAVMSAVNWLDGSVSPESPGPELGATQAGTEQTYYYIRMIETGRPKEEKAHVNPISR